MNRFGYLVDLLSVKFLSPEMGWQYLEFAFLLFLVLLFQYFFPQTTSKSGVQIQENSCSASSREKKFIVFVNEKLYTNASESVFFF